MCCLLLPPLSTDEHAAHPGVVPHFLMSSFVICGLRLDTSFSPGTSVGGGAVCLSCHDMRVLISVPSLPGTGSHGVPVMLLNVSLSHLCARTPLFLIECTLMTPCYVPIKYSLDLSLIPRHIPLSHLQSALSFPALSGLGYHTVSPNPSVPFGTFCLLFSGVQSCRLLQFYFWISNCQHA